MALRKELFAVGEYYHLYSRGVDKRKIFLNAQDYRKFQFLMYVCNSEKSIILRNIGKNFDRGGTIVDVGAFCLMPNHFHILAREKIENGISLYMRKLLTGYSMYFNLKHTREGKLFDGAFKAINAGDDRYLKYLYSYIHLNPAKLIDKNWKNSVREDNKEILNFCLLYPNSSIGEYKNSSYKIINPRRFPDYFPSPTSHMKELAEWLQLTP